MERPIEATKKSHTNSSGDRFSEEEIAELMIEAKNKLPGLVVRYAKGMNIEYEKIFVKCLNPGLQEEGNRNGKDTDSILFKGSGMCSSEGDITKYASGADVKSCLTDRCQTEHSLLRHFRSILQIA